MRQTKIIYRETSFFFFSEDEDAELIVKKHIALLHLYNETKDATQVRVSRDFLFYFTVEGLIIFFGNSRTQILIGRVSPQITLRLLCL